MSKKKNKNKNKNSNPQPPKDDGIQNANTQNSIPPHNDSGGCTDTGIANENSEQQSHSIQKQPECMQNFYLELPSAENVDSTSSEDWHLGHEENYAAEVRVRTLFSSIQCEGTEPSSVREEDIRFLSCMRSRMWRPCTGFPGRDLF